VGGTCSTHGGGESCLQGFGWEALRQETTGKTYHIMEEWVTHAARMGREKLIQNFSLKP